MNRAYSALGGLKFRSSHFAPLARPKCMPRQAKYSSNFAGPTIETISTPKAVKPLGHYSQAFKANGTVWVAGQIAADVDGRLVEDSIDVQANQIFQNLNEVLKEAGTSLTNVVKVTIYTTDMDVLPAFNQVYNVHLPHKPPRTSVEVRKLPLNVSIFMDVVAIY